VCFRAKLDSHIHIPPRAIGELAFVVKATAPGPFQADLRIFLDTGYLEMPTVGIRGTAVGEPVVNDP